MKIAIYNFAKVLIIFFVSSTFCYSELEPNPIDEAEHYASLWNRDSINKAIELYSQVSQNNQTNLTSRLHSKIEIGRLFLILGDKTERNRHKNRNNKRKKK